MPNPYANAPRSITDVCNLALGDIGWTRYLTDISDQTPEGTTCARVYPQAIAEVSRDIDWPGLTQHQALAQLTPSSLQSGAVPQNWRFAYALPASCCRLRGIFPYSNRLAADASADASTPAPQSKWNDNAFRIWHRNPDTYRQVRYVRESDSKLGQIILCDEPQPIAEFVSALADLSQADPDFMRAVHYLVAHYIAGPLAKDSAKAEEMLSLHQRALSIAVANAKNEEQTDPAPMPAYIRARGWGGWGGGRY